MMDKLIVHVENIETTLRDLPLTGALANDDRVDGAIDAATLALRYLLATIAGVAIERAIEAEA